jgi:hypothetical protein
VNNQTTFTVPATPMLNSDLAEDLKHKKKVVIDQMMGA